MKIAIIPNFTKKDTYEVALAIYDELLRLGVQVFFEEKYSDRLSACSQADFSPAEELYRVCDWVVAVGGDGSIIHASKNAAINRKPVLGVNTGYLAFMAGLEKNQLHCLEQLINGEHILEKRLVLKTEIIENGKVQSVNYSVNDAVFSRGAEISLVNIIVECNGSRVNEYRADGIVISTPTGSTAYSLSAGGSVADPSAECILMTPIANHSLMSRPMIFRADSVLSVYPAEGSINPVYLSFDGEAALVLKEGSRAVVSKADFSVDFIRLKSYTFWDTLYTKLFRN